MNTPASDLTTLGPARRAATAIPPPRRRLLTRVIVPAAVVLVAAGLLAYAARDSLLPAKAVFAVQVVAKPVEVSQASAASAGASAGEGTPGSLGSVVAQAPGWLEPDPYPLFVSALTDGVVEQMKVLEGEPVKQGQVVATMVADEARFAVQRAEAELSRRQADLKTADAQLAAARTDWENPVERDRAVAVAEAGVSEIDAEIKRLDHVIHEHQARTAELKRQHERLVKLLPNATSELEVEQARYRFEAQQALLDGTAEQQNVLRAQLAAQQAELAAARENRRLRTEERRMLAESEANVTEARGAVRDAEVALDEAKLRLERMSVRAAADGVVMTRIAGPGDKLMLAMDAPHSAHVVHLYVPAQLQVRVDVPLADAAKVGVGQAASIVVDVLPNRTFRGKLTRVVHKASIEKNTLEVKVAIEDPSPELKPDMLARVKFHAPPRNPATASSNQSQQGVASGGITRLRVFVPGDVLINRSGETADVWRVDPTDSTARRTAVTLGPHEEQGWLEVAVGLNAGDVVIVEPLDHLTDGERVAPTLRNTKPKGGAHGPH